ncbi:MAG: hypothetical protein J4F30_08510 [Acidobacteria bacterium]|nr:hypothetical protein [Acidobacteriota bacterium]
MRLAETTDAVAVPALAELGAELVLGVHREVVVERGAAARAERHAVNVAVLVQIRRHDKGVGDGRAYRRAYRQPADLLRGAQVALHAARVEPAKADVVESGAGVVGRQQVRDIDLQRKQVADGVAVLGGVEAAQRIAASRIRVGRGRAEGRQAVVRLAIRARPACRRHHAGPQFQHDLLPYCGVGAQVAQVERFQGESGGAQAVVVAGDTVAFEQRLLGRGGMPRRRLRPASGREHRACGNGNERDYGRKAEYACGILPHGG